MKYGNACGVWLTTCIKLHEMQQLNIMGNLFVLLSYVHCMVWGLLKNTYPKSTEVLKENILFTYKSILGLFSDLLKIATLGVSPYKVFVTYKFKSLIS